MRTFVYEAIDEHGQLIEGRLDGRDSAAVGAALRRHGLTLVNLRRSRAVLGAARMARRVPTADVAGLAHYVAVTSRAGLPVVDGIEDFAREHPSARVRAVLEGIVADVRGGETLTRAFEAQAGAFGDDFLSMLKAGEASGTLEASMSGVADQLRFQLDVRGQVKQALVQPAILLTAVGGLIVLLITFLLPRILTLLTESGGELPAPTRLLLGLSNGLRAHGLFVLAGIAAAVAGLAWARRHPRGRLVICHVLLRLPAVAPIVAMSAQARFVSTMVSLLGAGVDAVTSLRLAATTTGSAVLEQQLDEAAERVADGHTLTEALEAVSGLHPLVRSMVRLGERSGSLVETLETAVDWFSTELPRRIRQAVALIEPAVIAVSGLLVAFILLSVMLPLFSLYDAF